MAPDRPSILQDSALCTALRRESIQFKFAMGRGVHNRFGHAGLPPRLRSVTNKARMQTTPASDRQSDSGALVRGWKSIRNSPLWIVSIALLLRVGWIIIGHTYKFKTIDNNFSFGWEMGRIGV